jgi:hypothetical protein
MGRPLDLCVNAVRLQVLHRAPPQQPTMSIGKPERGHAASVQLGQNSCVRDQVGLSHCWHDGLVMVQDEARLRRDHNDQSCRGHQCGKTRLTGESRFHSRIPLGIEPRSLMTGSKWVDCWTSGTVCECSEIAGSLHHVCYCTLYMYVCFHVWTKTFMDVYV